MTKFSKLIAPVLGVGAAAAIAVSALGGSPAHAAHSQSTGTTTSDTITSSWRSPDLPWLWSIHLPKMVCPASHPYTLKQQFNGGSGFRIGPGIEIKDYQKGLDVVALSNTRIPFEKGTEKGHIRTGISGDRDVILNSATNWGSTSKFTVVLHCTSDAEQGIFERPYDS
ncbi:MAG: hypothetical protein JO181_05900 [Solirubrobacterales bacterium]|nr:hypothetical protein [Solirubrobacterales bacterium]MBV9799861.1 hypothetical protein [Solirubrobacterales bacterium]